MERVLLGLFRLGVLAGIFAWAVAAVDLSRSLRALVDGLMAGWVQ